MDYRFWDGWSTDEHRAAPRQSRHRGLWRHGRARSPWDLSHARRRSNVFSFEEQLRQRHRDVGSRRRDGRHLLRPSDRHRSGCQNGSLTGADIKTGSIKGSDQKDGNVTSSDLLDGSINSSDVGWGSLNGGDIADGSLLARDFELGELPSGAAGPKGDTGLAGAKGDTGAAGADGKDGTGGASTVTVRSTVGSLPMSCQQVGTDPAIYHCNGSGPVTASCEPGERATGGGHSESANGSSATQGGADRPNPTTGMPTGWTVDMQAYSYGSDHPETLPTPPVYVLCMS